MGNLAVKEVSFNGDILMAAQDKTTEKVYVGVRWVCDGLGLSEGQMKSERKRIQDDLVLSQGGRNLILPTNGGNQELQCIELDFLPLWLAKISITPKMKLDNPETVDKLIQYQIKAKDVLANAFIHNVTQIVPQTYKEALVALIDAIDEKEKLEAVNQILLPKAERHDQIASGENLVGVKKVGLNIGIGERKFFEFLRMTKVFYKEGNSNLPYIKYQNKKYFDVVVTPNVDKEGIVHNTYTTKVTGAGEIFILNMVNKYGGADLINSLKLKDIESHILNYKFSPKSLEAAVSII